jgi:hypothetical protein
MIKISLYKHFFSGIILSLFSIAAVAQNRELVLFGGVTNYVGDLQQKVFSAPSAKGVIGVNYKQSLNEHFWLRAGASVGQLYGSDANNEESLQLRNLSFESQVVDGYVAAEYRLFTEEKSAITPYAFLGIGVFGFNPYVRYGDKNDKVFLQPLGTEGQGLPEYPEREMYSLTQLMVPIGGGILWQVNDKWQLGIEFRNNFTFTDYIDDVSTKYADQTALLRDRGPIAVELAWRGDEINGRPYPASGSQRGNPKYDDWFYYLGFQAGFKLPGGSKKGKNQMGCPQF